MSQPDSTYRINRTLEDMKASSDKHMSKLTEQLKELNSNLKILIKVLSSNSGTK